MEIVRTRMANSRTATAIGLILVALGLADSFMQPSAFGGSRIGSSSTLGRARVCSRAARGLALRAEKVGESMMQYDVSEESNEDSSKPIVVQIEQKVKEVINKPAQMEMEREVFKMCAMTNRGQGATLYEREAMESAVDRLKALEVPFNRTALNGEWRLVYASEAVTRSSPFFWAFRKATSGTNQPLPMLPSALSEALFAITDGIPFASVGTASQTISGMTKTECEGTLVSSVQVSLRVFDAILPPNVGYVTTTSKLSDLGGADGRLKLTVETTEVKDSTWGEVPVLGQAFEGTKFPSGETLERFKLGSSSVDMTIEYLSEAMRITRADDGQLFVHTRV